MRIQSTMSERFQRLPLVTVPSVQIVLLREGTNGTEVFLGERNAGGFCPQWAFPGGKIDEESAREAARRELYEETGADVAESNFNFLRHTRSSTIRTKNGRRARYRYEIEVFTVDAQYLNPTNASPGEHTRLEWMTLESALQVHKNALKAVGWRRLFLSPDKISGGLAPRTRETIQMLRRRGK